MFYLGVSYLIVTNNHRKRKYDEDSLKFDSVTVVVHDRDVILWWHFCHMSEVTAGQFLSTGLGDRTGCMTVQTIVQLSPASLSVTYLLPR